MQLLGHTSVRAHIHFPLPRFVGFPVPSKPAVMLDVCAFPPSSKRAALADGPHSIRETDVQTQGQLSKTILTWTHTHRVREKHTHSVRVQHRSWCSGAFLLLLVLPLYAVVRFRFYEPSRAYTFGWSRVRSRRPHPTKPKVLLFPPPLSPFS